MSLAALEAAIVNLLACAPAPSKAPRLDKENAAEELIASAARFAEAVQQAGSGEELDRLANLLPALMGEMEGFRKAASAAIMAHLQPEAKRPPKRVSFYIADGKDRFFPLFVEPDDVERFVGDASSVLMHLPRSVKYAHQLSQWNADAHVKAFADVLWEVWRRAEREHLWGFFLIAQCRAAANPDQHRNLVVLLASMPEAFQAITGAAESLLVAQAAQAVPALSQRQFYILQALLEMNATSPERLRTTKQIAKKVEAAASPAAFKEATADLKKRGLIATKEGRYGGCWLTPDGLKLAQQIVRKQ